MITVELKDNNLILRYNYYYRGRVAQIPGYRFNYDLKAAEIPVSSLGFMESTFPGEIYYKTPRWQILGQSEPPKEEIPFFKQPVEVPELKFPPFNYQKFGCQFMVDRIEQFGFVLNSDSMGLGKTYMSIATMLWYMQNRGVRKVLIVCKKSVKLQWASEIQKFTNTDVPIFVTQDAKKKRMKAYESMRNSQSGILITSYHNYLNDTDEIIKDDYGFCVIDEVHSLKARSGVMHRNIAKVVRGKRLVLLTGTPVMSKPDDIYGIISIANKDYFKTYADFQKRYIVGEYGIYGYQIVGAQHLDELQERIKQFMIRRTEYDIDLDLPEELPPSLMRYPMDNTQNRMMAYVQALKEELDNKKQELLDKYAKDVKNGIVPEKVKAIIEDINARSKMYIATMQFISDDPDCFNYMSPDRGINKEMLKFVPKNYSSSEKTEGTIELVENIISAGEKVIIFCHFATPAQMLKDKIEKRLQSQYGKTNPYEVVLYTGAEGDRQREQNVAKFRANDNCRVLIATEAAAEGLNLQVSKYMIHYEQADTYAQRRQRIGRIRRIGSKFSHISVYDMCTNGSFDDIKLKKLERDKNLADALVGE